MRIADGLDVSAANNGIPKRASRWEEASGKQIKMPKYHLAARQFCYLRVRKILITVLDNYNGVAGKRKLPTPARVSRTRSEFMFNITSLARLKSRED